VNTTLPFRQAVYLIVSYDANLFSVFFHRVEGPIVH